MLFFKYMGLGLATVCGLLIMVSIISFVVEDSSSYLTYKDAYILVSKWTGGVLLISAIIGLFYRLIGV